MELKQVHKWVDLYFEGKTTLEQEKALAAYFSQPSVDDNLVPYKPYFTAISKERTQRFEGEFTPKSTKYRWLNLRVAAVAASLVIGFFAVQQTLLPAQPSPEEIAFEEFKANMYRVAEHLNKGKQGVAYMETFNQTTNKFIKSE